MEDVLGDNALGALAESMLEPPISEVVKKSSVYPVCGRRPLKKLPNLWLSHPELVGILEMFELINLPQEYWKIAFRLADQQATTEIMKGRKAEMLPASRWLMSFCAREALAIAKASMDSKRSEIYLKKAST